MPPIPEHIRAWLYRIALAAVALAAVYGLVGEDEVTGWTALIGAVLSSGLATANTTTKRQP